MPVIDVSTVQQAIDAIQGAHAGDEIVFAAGDYAFTGNINASAVGTQASPIKVHGPATGGVNITFGSATTTIEGFKVSGAYWEFSKLNVSGTCTDDSMCEHSFHVFGAADHFSLHDCVLQDFNAEIKVNATVTGTTGVQPNAGHIFHNQIGDTRGRNTSNPVTKVNMDTGDDWVVSDNIIYDAHKLQGDTTSYGAFMKSGGHRGTFERNVVFCDRGGPGANGGTRIGLSFGGGGTAPQFCAPAYDANTPCNVEHTDGIIRNNFILNCSDVGVYLNRATNTKVLFNTLIDTTGIDYRFATTSGDAYANVLAGKVRPRDTATVNDVMNLADVTHDQFVQWYPHYMDGDFSGGTDVATAVGAAPARAEVTDDFCGRTRPAGNDTRGAIEHTLGDCASAPPPVDNDGSLGGRDDVLGDDDGGGGGGSGGCCEASGGNPAGSLVLAVGFVFAQLRRRRVRPK
ncbi:MAG TPA: chondroitinase-B domain-containing protein [Kofleriaceae bacterium]|jgi:hypothetical protein